MRVVRVQTRVARLIFNFLWMSDLQEIIRCNLILSTQILNAQVVFESFLIMYLLSLFLPSLVKKQIEKTDGLHKLQSAFYGIEAYDEQFREYCIFMPVDKVLANDEFVDTRKPHPQSM